MPKNVKKKKTPKNIRSVSTGSRSAAVPSRWTYILSSFSCSLSLFFLGGVLPDVPPPESAPVYPLMIQCTIHVKQWMGCTVQISILLSRWYYYTSKVVKTECSVPNKIHPGISNDATMPLFSINSLFPKSSNISNFFFSSLN